jgi:TRAP-type C4-dicarboxylate transport system permease large subunit
VSAFVVAAVVLVVLAFAAAVAVAVAQERVATRLTAAAPTMKRWGGVVLMVVGLWFVALGLFAETFAEVFPV